MNKSKVKNEKQDEKPVAEEQDIENDKSEIVIMALGKVVVNGYEDYQSIRIAQMSRIRDIVRRTVLGIPMDKPEDKIEAEDKKFEKNFSDKKMISSLQKLLASGKLSKEVVQYIEKLLKLSIETRKTENRYKGLMNQYLQNEKIWNIWLEKIKGISSVLASNLIKNLGYCEKYQYVSSVWRHCGLDPDGAKGRVKGQKITYSPKLKVMAWKIGDSFIKQRTQPYRGIYDAEKARQLSLMKNEAERAPKSLLHADRRAKRKMVKVFLQHYYIISRQIVGLPLTEPYAIGKLGHKHYIKPPFNPFEKQP